MKHGTTRGPGAPGLGYQVAEQLRCYSGETDPMQRLFALAYLQAQKARQEAEKEPQKDADCRCAVIATQQHIAEAHLSLEQSLELIVDQARRITGADGAAIALRDSGDFVCRGRSGMLAPDLGARVNMKSGISGACLRTGEVQQCDDTETDLRVEPAVCRDQGIRSVVAVPVRHRNVLGILAVFAGWAGVFSERDVRALSGLAGLVAARLPQDAPTVAGVAATRPVQPGLDTPEALHAAERTVRRNAELPPALLDVREARARQGWKSLKSAVLALAVLAVTSEAVVWGGLHVNKISGMAKAILAMPTPGAMLHPSTLAITLPSAATSPAQTTLKTFPRRTLSPASATGVARETSPRNAPGEKGSAAPTKMLGDSHEASVVANPPRVRLEGPVPVHSLSVGLETTQSSKASDRNYPPRDQVQASHLASLGRYAPVLFRQSLMDRLSGGLAQGAPYRIAADSQGRLLVTDAALSVVQVFDTRLGKRWQIRGDRHHRLSAPALIAVDADDNIYLTELGQSAVSVIQPSGRFLRMIGLDVLRMPTGICVDKQNRRLYVADWIRNEILSFDLEGKLLQIFGSFGTALGQLNHPLDVLVHGSTLIVLDAGNFRFELFDLQGKVRGVWPYGPNRRPIALASDVAGNLYYADLSSGGLVATDPDGKVLAGFDQRPFGQWVPRSSSGPNFMGLALDPLGNILALRPTLEVEVLKLVSDTAIPPQPLSLASTTDIRSRMRDSR